MDEIILWLSKELSQIQDHATEGELHQYIDDNANEIMRKYSRFLQLLTKGAEQDAA